MLGGLLLLGMGSVASGATPQPEPKSQPTGDRLEDCRRAVETEGVSRATVTCFYDVARREERWDEVREELDARVAAPGASVLWKLPLASMMADQGQMETAVVLLSEVEQALPDTTVGNRAFILANRGQFLRVLDRYDDAEADFRALVELGRSSGVVGIEVAGQMELGALLLRREGDLSEVREIFDRVVPQALESGNYVLGNKALTLRVKLSKQQHRTHQVREDYELMLARAEAQGDAYDQAHASMGLLDLEIAQLDLRDEDDVPSDVRTRLDDTWRAVRASKQQHSIAFLECVEGDLDAGLLRHGEAARKYGRCARAYGEMGGARGELKALTWQAVQLALDGQPDVARAQMEQVDEQVHARGMQWAYGSYALGVIAFLEGDVERAVALGRRHFEEIERYRELQSDEEDRSRSVSMLSPGYYLVAGTLLREHADSPAMLDEAFMTIERMRARNLLDGLRRSDAMRPDPEDPDEQRWQAVVGEIAELQRVLLGSSLDDAERSGQLSRLDELEARERRLRDALAAGDGELGTLLVPEFPKLEEVQAMLGEGEAILSYQISDEKDAQALPEGGSWLWVLTRDEVHVIPLPERRRLERRLGFIGGLFARRDGREAEAMARFHQELIAPALELLPASVQRLVIVPDGALWSLPFAALVEEPGAEPLIARYSLALVPSVTSWMRWGDRAPAVTSGLLALAQPQLGAAAAAEFRQGTLASGIELGALPRAVDEVEAITRIWDAGPSEAEVGEEASEHFLKESDLSRYGLLHFATHAVMDPEHPDRSAVVLAAGGEHEDGLLQAREIVRLPLSGKVVVLSACSGAAGTFVRGEGVMSLARAFLQGGAQAVVASRWPLADADAMALFERLYLHLDEGHMLSDALALAQRDLIEAGAPAAAWAGVVVLGRGDVVLVPRPSWWRWRRSLLGFGAVLALLAGFGLRWRSAAKA